MGLEIRMDCATGKVTEHDFTPEPAPPPEDIPAEEIRRRILSLVGVRSADEAKVAEVFMAALK